MEDVGKTVPGGGGGPHLHVLRQYIRDLSFESPNAPDVSGSREKSPEIGIHVDIGVNKLSAEEYSVDLRLNVDAKEAEKQLFLIELVYTGIFHLINIPEENLQSVLLVECPRQIFPFARRVVADIVRDGGFPPLMIDPIDFTGLYRREIEKAQTSAATATKN